jgi:hypothetical protein
MEKILRYVIIGLAAIIAVGIYELVQVYRTSGNPYIWRTENWKQTDTTLADLQPATPDVPRADYTEKIGKVYSKQPGVVEGTGYTITDPVLKQMEEDIRITAPKASETELSLKRAIYLKKLASVAFTKPSPEREKILADVYEQLHYGMFRLPAITINEQVDLRYIRRYYSHVLEFVYQGTKNPEIFFNSKFSEGRYFKELVAKYGTKNKNVVNTLYIDSLYSNQDMENDNFVLAGRLQLLSQLFLDEYVLSNDYIQENGGLRTELYKKAANLAEQYPSAKQTKVHIANEENITLPKVAYAHSLGILSRLPNSRITAKMARDAFEEARASLKENVRSSEDILYWSWVRLVVAEAEFLFRVNEEQMTPEIHSLLVEAAGLREVLSSSRESSEWYNRFFKDVIRDVEVAEKENRRRPFLDMAKEVPAMQKILDELSQ